MIHWHDDRDWNSPRDPGALEALLHRFAEACSGVDSSVPVMLSACPEWFDDTGHATREFAAIGPATVATASGPWDDIWLADDGVEPPTAGERSARRLQRFETALSTVPGDIAPLLRSLVEASQDGGAFGREAVESAVQPLESEEIAAFFRPANGLPMLVVSGTNGGADVAYGLSPDGELLVWIDADMACDVKEDIFPSVPTKNSILVSGVPKP